MSFSRLKKAVVTAAAAIAGIATLFTGAAAANAAGTSTITLTNIPSGAAEGDYSWAKVGSLTYGEVTSGVAKEASVTSVESAFQKTIVSDANKDYSSLPSWSDTDDTATKSAKAVRALEWYLSKDASAAQQQKLAGDLANVNTTFTPAGLETTKVNSGSLTLSGLDDDSVYLVKDLNGLALLVFTGDSNVSKFGKLPLNTAETKPTKVPAPTKTIDSINGTTVTGDNLSVQNGDTIHFTVSHKLTAAEMNDQLSKKGTDNTYPSYLDVHFTDTMTGLQLLNASGPDLAGKMAGKIGGNDMTIHSASAAPTKAQDFTIDGTTYDALLVPNPATNPTSFNLYLNGAAIAENKGWYSTSDGVTNPKGSVQVSITYSALVTNEDAATASDNAGKHNNSATVTIGTTPTSTPTPKTMWTLAKFHLTKEDLNAPSTTLPGAQFALTYVPAPGSTQYVHVSGSNGDYQVSSVNSKANSSAGNTDNIVTTDSDGTITINGLGARDGYYELKETKAPSGYETLPAAMPDITFKTVLYHRLESDGTHYYYTLGNVTEKNKLVEVTDNDPSKVVVYNVKSITELPKTGAAGITFFVILGLLLLAIAGGIALVAVRNRRQARLAQASVE